MGSIKLGILEFGLRRDKDSVSIVNDVLDFAIEVEKLGFHRFWLAEHHYFRTLNLPFSSPDVIIALIAGMTEKIKIGAAGVSIPSYSPYSVVTNYKLLNNLYTGRIDLGLSKGVAESIYTKNIMNEQMMKKGIHRTFSENLETIYSLLNEEDKNLKEKNILIPPYRGLKPELWYLSTSLNNAEEAIRFECNYCISLFHNSGKYFSILKSDKCNNDIECFKQSYYNKNMYLPKIAVAIAVNFDTKNNTSSNIKNTEETFKVLSLTVDELVDLIYKFYYNNQIDEFIIFDTELDSHKKLENAIMISERIKL